MLLDYLRRLELLPRCAAPRESNHQDSICWSGFHFRPLVDYLCRSRLFMSPLVTRALLMPGGRLEIYISLSFVYILLYIIIYIYARHPIYISPISA
jgi:hypothetical protein